jgi:MFS family permease
MIPWADEAGAAGGRPDYKAVAQGCWAAGAIAGSFLGAVVAARLGRRRSYALISGGSAAATAGLYLLAEPPSAGFLTAVLVQGFVATLYFGWLPLYLPELFPTAVRATGTGLAYNAGRFVTAGGVLAAGGLVAAFDGDVARAGAAAGCVYAAGVAAAWLLPPDHGGARSPT